MTHFMEQTKDRQHGGGLRPVQVEIGFDDLVGLPDRAWFDIQLRRLPADDADDGIVSD